MGVNESRDKSFYRDSGDASKCSAQFGGVAVFKSLAGGGCCVGGFFWSDE